MNPNPPLDAKTKTSLFQVIPSAPSGTRTKQPQQSAAVELMRGNTDVLDRIHPQLGPGLLVVSCLLVVLGLRLKRKKQKPTDGGFAGMC